MKTIKNLSLLFCAFFALVFSSCDPAVKTELLPILTTTDVSSINFNSAKSGGNITSDAGSTVTARGVCWSTNANPTISDSKTTDGAGIGIFTSAITGLSAGTVYYVRAYATNSEGTSYGSVNQFTTFSLILSTTAASNVRGNTATVGGNITADGGVAITARGVCWSTSPSPTIANSKTSDGTAVGVFSSSLTGLTSSTTYYARAYATNALGTSYGNEVSFTTSFYGIGASYLGGKIAYVDASGVHGFVCALADQSSSVQWYNGSYITTGATNTVLETTGVYGISKSGGRKNTDAIILKQGAGTYAASICAALTIGGATAGDWYLPSNGELNEIYVNRVILGGFAAGYYWSSSEFNGSGAWAQFFSNGVQYGYNKSLGFCVRAVRAF